MYSNTVSNNLIYNNFKNVQQRFSKHKKSDLKNFDTENSSTHKTNDKKNKLTIIGLSTLGVGMLFMSKGVQKHSKNFLEFLKGHLENKLNNSFLDEHTPKISFYEHFIRRINSFIRKSESINNINSLKDILFMKLMYKTSPTRAIHKSISTFFENISRNTVKRSYKKNQKRFNEMYNKFDKLDDYILKHFGDETVEFNENTQQARYKYIKDATSQLYTKFWEVSFKEFWTKNNKFKRKEMWQTFIAAEQLKANKTDLAKNIAFTRDMLSYTDAEMKAYISGYLENINSIVSANDIDEVNIIKKLKWLIKDSSSLEFHKENFLNELNKLEQHYNQNKESDQIVNDINTNIKLIRNIIKKKPPGICKK